MPSGSGPPPLPPPQHPVEAARAISEAARAVACAWSQPLDPIEHSRSVSQLYSILRDLGIASRGLAGYQTDDSASSDFPQLVAAGGQWLLEAWQSLDGVLAAEGLGPVPDPDEPGAILCRAARKAITAWRQPAGTSADRDSTVELLITAIGFLAAATMGLAAYAPRRRMIDLRAVGASLAEATACLAKAIRSSCG